MSTSQAWRRWNADATYASITKMIASVITLIQHTSKAQMTKHFMKKMSFKIRFASKTSKMSYKLQRW